MPARAPAARWPQQDRAYAPRMRAAAAPRTVGPFGDALAAYYEARVAWFVSLRLTLRKNSAEIAAGTRSVLTARLWLIVADGLLQRNWEKPWDKGGKTLGLSQLSAWSELMKCK